MRSSLKEVTYNAVAIFLCLVLGGKRLQIISYGVQQTFSFKQIWSSVVTRPLNSDHV